MHVSNAAAPGFRGGRNIAMKLPPHVFANTLRFYEHALGLTVVERRADSVALEFGHNRLWLDRVPTLSQAEIWLEVVTDDAAAAATHLQAHEVVRCDAIEPLPPGFRGYWIASPANVVHLVTEPGQ
jgi:catechol 2,3-dioxygenase-like lactoylglutathione lyase family enzyme